MYDKCYFCLDQLPKLKKESTASFFVTFWRSRGTKEPAYITVIIRRFQKWSKCKDCEFDSCAKNGNMVPKVAKGTSILQRHTKTRRSWGCNSTNLLDLVLSICVSTSGGIRAMASTRDFFWHSFHFRPPMY